ncbi:leucine rich repeat-containing protein, partial [Toxoplasma gondii GAB2-2007-GAL-DOM2]
MEVGPSVQSPRTRCFSGVAEQLDAAMPAPVQDGQVDSMSTSDFSCSSSLLVEGAGANRSVDCLRGQLDSRGKAETQNFLEQLEGNSQYLTTAIGLIGKQADSFHGPASLAHPADRCEHAEGGVNFSAERRPRGFMGLERDREEADEREGERARKRWRGAERTRQQVHVERKSFAELPQEVLELIFSRLGLADLSRCLCVAKSWHPPLNAVFAKTIVSLGTSRRLLLTDAQLEALLKRCPAVHTVELDCFLLTPRGAALLGNAPSLVSLSLTSVDHQTDEFFYALADVISGIESFSVAIFDRSKHITNAALEHLAGRLQKLQAFSVEISFRENLDFFVLALTRASAGTLRHVTLYDVSEECLVQLTAAIGKNLLSFSYTKTSSTSLPISDWLLQYLPLRMPRLTSLRLVDAVTPGVLAQVSSPFSSLFVSARRRRRRRRETELDRERVRERGRARERGREREREQERVPPLVSPAGLSCLRPLAGHLEVLALSRSFGLPFTHATDVDLLQFFADFSPRLRELELNGFTKMSDGFLHEVLVACAEARFSAAPSHDSSPSSLSSCSSTSSPCPSLSSVSRASPCSPASAAPPLRGPGVASGFKLKKLSLEAADISDLGLHAIATALGSTAETLCLKRCANLSEAGHCAVAEYCRNLTSLNLGFCSGVNDLSVCSLLQSCPSLRTLVLNDAR